MPSLIVSTNYVKSVPMPETQEGDTIMINNLAISMAATVKDLDKFEEAFVSTLEVEILCGDNSPKQQEEVLIEDVIGKEEEQ